MPALKMLLTILAIAIYIAISHTALLMEDNFSLQRQLAVMMLIFPFIGFLCWSAWQAIHTSGMGLWLQWVASGSIGVCLAWLTWDVRTILLTQLDIIYLIQHVSINTLLCWFFSHTLYGGRTPAITAIAGIIHKNMPDSIVKYTRKVTVAWALFFAMQVMLSLAIFHTASITTWSVFANILHWPMIALMFAFEYICRKRYNPEFQHAGIQQSILAYLHHKQNT